MRAFVWHLFALRRYPAWRKHLRETRALARVEPDRFLRWQERAVDAHLAWCRTHVPHHRGRGETLAEFPVLTREDVQRHGDALRVPGAGEPVSSGGSTGEPVTIYTDRTLAIWSFATRAFVYGERGLPPWTPCAYVWGLDTPLRPGLRERLLPTPVLDAFHMDEDSMARFARALERRPPGVLIGYASALDVLAGFLARTGRTVRPRTVVSTAEALSDDQRGRLEAAFGCKVFNGYGSRECPYLAYECPEGGLHACSHGRLLEIVDGEGRPQPPGVPGRVLVTDFRNRAFGVVRYANGDVASWAEDPHGCACGCVFPRLARVHGRTSDFITAPTGEKIHGEWFTHLFYGQAQVRGFQVRQPSPEELTVLTVGDAGEREMEPLLARIRERMGPQTHVTWQRVDAIPLTPAGKHRYTISDVPY